MCDENETIRLQKFNLGLHESKRFIRILLAFVEFLRSLTIKCVLLEYKVLCDFIVSIYILYIDWN